MTEDISKLQQADEAIEALFFSPQINTNQREGIMLRLLNAWRRMYPTELSLGAKEEIQTIIVDIFNDNRVS